MVNCKHAACGEPALALPDLMCFMHLFFQSNGFFKLMFANLHLIILKLIKIYEQPPITAVSDTVLLCLSIEES